MIKATWQYLRDEAKPRAKDILSGAEFWLALLMGIACGAYGEVFLDGETKIGDVITGLLTYAAIALGFCVAGLTIALTLPDREFTKKLAATNRDRKSSRDAYSDLLFVFSWTAVCHWVAVVIFLCICVFASSKNAIVLQTSSGLRRIVLGVTIFVTVYGALQFLITLITLSQVGRVYINSLNNRQSQ